RCLHICSLPYYLIRLPAQKAESVNETPGKWIPASSVHFENRSDMLTVMRSPSLAWLLVGFGLLISQVWQTHAAAASGGASDAEDDQIPCDPQSLPAQPDPADDQPPSPNNPQNP
ncbi:hypothetical protein AAVH_31055, partial [Aphelenchoides avenae]